MLYLLQFQGALLFYLKDIHISSYVYGPVQIDNSDSIGHVKLSSSVFVQIIILNQRSWFHVTRTL